MAGNQNVLPPEWRDWNIIDELGEGSFGVVYKVEKVSGSVRALSAVKIIRVPPDDSQIRELAQEFPSTQAVAAYLKDLVQNYENEISTMYNLQGDSNIVSIQDHLVRQDPDGIQWKIYIRMELLTSFSEYMLTRNITQQDVIRLGISMCNALIKCEKLHIIHRDIKPDNIFVSKTGDFKLGDFGISRHLDRSFGNYSTKGTMNYMAPEVYKGDKYGSNVDLYSLGIILYKLTNRNFEPFLDTGQRMIYYKDKQLAFEKRMSGEPMPRPVDASPALADVIMKACAYDPQARYQNAAQMRADLMRAGNLLSGGRPAPMPGATGPQVSGPAPGTGRSMSGSGPVPGTGRSMSGSGPVPGTGRSMNGSGPAFQTGRSSPAASQPPKKKTGLIAAIAALVLVVAVGGIVLLRGMGNNSSSDDAAQAKKQTEQNAQQTEKKQTEAAQTEQKQSEAAQMEQKQTEAVQTEQKQAETAQTEQKQTEAPQTEAAQQNAPAAAGDAMFAGVNALPVTEKFALVEDQAFLEQLDILGEELAASKQGKNVLFAGALENASDEEMNAARDCIAWFKGNTDAGEKGFLETQPKNRVITAVEDGQGQRLVNYILFDPSALATAENGSPSDYARSILLCLVQEEESKEWKINVSEEAAQWKEAFCRSAQLLPAGLAGSVEGGDQNAYKVLYDGNMLYLNKNAAYAGSRECTPKFIWTDPDGNLAVSFLFSNGTSQKITWTYLSGTIQDTEGNLILDADVSLAETPVSVPAGCARLVTITFAKNVAGAAEPDLEKITEETVNFS